MFVGNFNLNAQAYDQSLRWQRLESQGVQQGKPQDPQPGTLYISDNWEPNQRSQGLEVCHGELVRDSALSTGYRGPLKLREFPQARYVIYDSDQGNDQVAGGDLRSQAYLASLKRMTQERYQNILRPATDELEQLSDSGVHHSVLNISMGTSKARVAESAYLDLATGKADGQGAASAFGLDLQKLSNPDLAVAQPERARLQQSLINFVDKTVDQSDSIKQAKQDYDQAVHRFTDQGNSLVHSGGNNGEVLELMQRENGGQPLKVSSDFWDSPLNHPQSLVVGATEGDDSLKPAGYSLNHPNELYASGQTPGFQERGSSFSSPKAAAMVAQLYRDNPQLSSSEVLSLFLSKLTDTAEGTQAPVLTPKAAQEILGAQTLEGSQDGWLLNP